MIPRDIPELIATAIFGIVGVVLAAAILAAMIIILANLARLVGKAIRPPKV